MNSVYHRFAGGNLERIGALSDGVFAIAMTLIVLELKLPPHASIQSEIELLQALVQLGPHFATYAMSFLTLAIFWGGQQAQLNSLAFSDRKYSMWQIAFLAGVAILPFSTSLLGEYIAFRTALIVYWFNLAMMGLILYLAWRYAKQTKLLKDDLPAEMTAAVEQRVVRAQTLYLIGAALCVVSTYLSIAFICAVQLIYAIAPKSRFMNRITRLIVKGRTRRAGPLLTRRIRATLP